MRKTFQTLMREELVDAWNKENPPGTVVTVERDSGEFTKTTTRSTACLLGGHTPVVWLVGIAGAYDLQKVTVRNG